MIKKNIGKINGIDYNEYMLSPEWKEKRIAVAQREDHVCQMCGQKVLVKYHIHHKTYARFGHEDLNDLMFLCEQCHSKLHRDKDKANGVVRKPIQRPKKVQDEWWSETSAVVRRKKRASKNHKTNSKRKSK